MIRCVSEAHTVYSTPGNLLDCKIDKTPKTPEGEGGEMEDSK